LADVGLIDIAGAPATEMGVDEVHDLGARDRAEEISRFVPHALGVQQVAGILISNAQRPDGIGNRGKIAEVR
jgi:hypothetical protein